MKTRMTDTPQILGPELRELNFAKLDVPALEAMSESERQTHARSMDLITLATFIRPALAGIKRLVAAYRPYVVDFMVRTAHQGEQKMLTNKDGEPATRDDVVREQLGVGVRRVQQLLAMTNPDKPEPTPQRLTPDQTLVVQALVSNGYKKKEAIAAVKIAGYGDFEVIWRAVMAQHPSNGNCGGNAAEEDVAAAVSAPTVSGINDLALEEFCLALSNLDYDAVQRTARYKELVDAAAGGSKAVDEFILHWMEHYRNELVGNLTSFSDVIRNLPLNK